MNTFDRIKAYVAQNKAAFRKDAETLTPKQTRRMKKKLAREEDRVEQKLADWQEQEAQAKYSEVFDVDHEAETRDIEAMDRATLEVEEVYYENLTRDELRYLAKLNNIPGRGAMNKAQLVQALRNS